MLMNPEFLCWLLPKLHRVLFAWVSEVILPRCPFHDPRLQADDLALPFGALRLKGKGSDGGHNGLKSIIDSIKSKNFWRIRIGIGHPGNKNLVSNFVLKPPLKKENELIEDSILNSYKIFSLLKSGQFEKAMLNLHSA